MNKLFTHLFSAIDFEQYKISDTAFDECVGFGL